jgi:hypothetical protein
MGGQKGEERMSLSPRAVRALKRYCGTVLLLACGCADDEPERSRPNPGQGSQAISYWQDVVPIFERHCMACHQEGGIGTFRLDDYAQAKAHAALIRHATSARTMPPWGVTSDGSCGTFTGSLALSEEQIATLAKWEEEGAKEGTPTQVRLPQLPRLDEAREYATPLFTPRAAGGEHAEFDEYRCFLLEPGLAEDSFITGYDVLPGTPEIVHHVMVSVVDPDALGEAEEQTNRALIDALDAESPDRDGWPCFGSAGDGVRDEADLVVWAPGQGKVEYPDQSGFRVRSTDKLVVQIHYNLAHAADRGKSDQTTVRLRIAKDVEKVALFAISDKLLDSIFEGQPEQLEPGKASVKYTWKMTLDEIMDSEIPNLELHGVMPHMHERGRKYQMKVTAGSEAEQCAADVQDWDFHWQRMYFYTQPYPLTGSSTIEVTCDYDTSDVRAPISPGWGTHNEMCAAILFFTAPRSALGY